MKIQKIVISGLASLALVSTVYAQSSISQSNLGGYTDVPIHKIELKNNGTRNVYVPHVVISIGKGAASSCQIDPAQSEAINPFTVSAKSTYPLTVNGDGLAFHHGLSYTMRVVTFITDANQTVVDSFGLYADCKIR